MLIKQTKVWPQIIIIIFIWCTTVYSMASDAELITLEKDYKDARHYWNGNNLAKSRKGKLHTDFKNFQASILQEGKLKTQRDRTLNSLTTRLNKEQITLTVKQKLYEEEHQKLLKLQEQVTKLRASYKTAENQVAQTKNAIAATQAEFTKSIENEQTTQNEKWMHSVGRWQKYLGQEVTISDEIVKPSSKAKNILYKMFKPLIFKYLLGNRNYTGNKDAFKWHRNLEKIAKLVSEINTCREEWKDYNTLTVDDKRNTKRDVTLQGVWEQNTLENMWQNIVLELINSRRNLDFAQDFENRLIYLETAFKHGTAFQEGLETASAAVESIFAKYQMTQQSASLRGVSW